MNEQDADRLRLQIRAIVFPPDIQYLNKEQILDRLVTLCAGHQAIGQANAVRNFSASLPAATRERERNAWLSGFDTAVDSDPSQWRFLRSRSPFEEVTTDGNDDEHGTPQPQ